MGLANFSKWEKCPKLVKMSNWETSQIDPKIKTERKYIAFPLCLCGIYNSILFFSPVGNNKILGLMSLHYYINRNVIPLLLHYYFAGRYVYLTRKVVGAYGQIFQDFFVPENLSPLNTEFGYPKAYFLHYPFGKILLVPFTLDEFSQRASPPLLSFLNTTFTIRQMP